MLLKKFRNHLFILLHFSIQLGSCTIATIKYMFLFFLLNIHFAENFNNYLSQKINDNINNNDEKKELLLKYKGMLLKDKNNVELLSYFILYFKDIVEFFNKYPNIPSEEEDEQGINYDGCNCEEWPDSNSDDENNENDNKSIGLEKDNNSCYDNDTNDDKSISTNISEVNIFDNCEEIVNIINPPLYDNESNKNNDNDKSIESHVSDQNIFSNCEKLINIINPSFVDEIKKDQ